MDSKKLMDDIMGWFKNPKTLKGLAMYAVVTVILALDFAYWAGAIEVEEYQVGEVVIIEIPETIEVEENYTLVEEVILDQTGPAGRGSPAGFNYEDVPFTVNEGAKLLRVYLTSDDPRTAPRETDYDLEVYGPDGSNAGTSAGPNYEEEVVLNYTKKANKTIPAGTYNARVIFWFNTAGTTWHLTVSAWYMEECGPEGCAIDKPYPAY